jgi:hypothetical protein
MKTLMYRLGVLFAALMGVLSIAAYTPFIGTAYAQYRSLH